MAKIGIKVGSVTLAMKGRDLLLKNGYRSYIARNLHPKKASGCGYLIIVSNYDFRCLSLLENGGVQTNGITEEGEL